MRIAAVLFAVIMMSASLGLATTVTGLALGNAYSESVFAGWLVGLGLLVIGIANCRDIAQAMGVGSRATEEEDRFSQ